MAFFLSGTEARLGALNIEPYLSLPPLPNILSEWAAIIPLVVHLASYTDDYITVGNVSLLGSLPLGLVPKLGTLSGFSRLFSRGREFLEQASHKGGSSRTVWDVRWGSVFPAANGAASAAILNLLVHGGRPSPVKMPGVAGYVKIEKTSDASSASTSTTVSSRDPAVPKLAPHSLNPPERSPPAHQYSRCQYLHVIRYDRYGGAKSLRARLEQIRHNKIYNVLVVVVFAIVAVPLCLCGMYGTAATLIMSACSRGFRLAIKIDRPPDYLLNNENHNAYFLTATHQNASEWYLHIGDRSIVDTLLNKPMLEIPINKKLVLPRDGLRSPTWCKPWR
jgi:hypothetical protein